ncbi:hypothetical protein OZX65_02070 [Leuconostocaceae bacterium ESL0723]|nr:hypothetical protein [Lactobacillaceae bacterium L1_55_11]WEV54868.1 hypothetical protein OZX65_02070 [Leuconostocaceae bacterium ESL0723]
MATLRDGSKENRESFEKAKDKHAEEHAAEAHEHKDDVDIEHAEHKDARYNNEDFEKEEKYFEGH